ncbi:MAG: DedA family protein [Pseudomonadota bacterium]
MARTDYVPKDGKWETACPMTDWIEHMIESAGYLGIAFLMFLENLFPPIPSEVIMPLAGYTAARGDGLSLAGVILAGSLGSLLGMTFWYYVGRVVGENRLKAFAARHGRWLTLRPRDIERVDRWFHDGGRWAILVGRCIPTIRTLISVPAGIFGMRLRSFLVLTFIGVAIWDAALAWLGWTLGGDYAAIDRYLGPVSLAIVAAILVFYLYRVATFRR